MRRALVFWCITCLLAMAISDQAQNAPADIKQKVDKIGIRENITVHLLDGKSYHGFIQKIDTDSFTIAEVDLRSDLTFKYSEVKKVQKGYGPLNGFTGKHSGPRKSWILPVVLAGALALPIIILASSRD